jgi:hypothetical protein
MSNKPDSQPGTVRNQLPLRQQEECFRCGNKTFINSINIQYIIKIIYNYIILIYMVFVLIFH